jgi:translation initiation factor IF-2
MPIKLIQVQRTLHVGINTVVEFLHKKGHDIEDNPNTRISDEQFALLVKEFGKDLTERDLDALFTPKRSPKKETPPVPEEEETEKDEIRKEEAEEPAPEEEPVKEHPPVAEKQPEEEEEPEAAEETPEEEIPAPEEEESVPDDEPEEEVEDEEDDDEPEEEVEEDDEPEEEDDPDEEENEEEEEIPVKEEETEEESATEENEVEKTAEEAGKEKDTPFRLDRPKLDFKVTGKINLEAMNQSTRPKKKTKEEKRKEREERYKTGGAANKPAQGGLHAPVKAPKSASESTGVVKPAGENKVKKKRKRIKKDRIDINNTPGTNTRFPQSANSGGNDLRRLRKRPVKTEVNEEDVQKQIKETLARLTNKGSKNKGAKYRRDKRDAAERRVSEQHAMEAQESRILKLTEFVTANDLANMMDVPVTQVIGTCMNIGMMVSINQRLDAETINIVVDEFGFKTEYVSAEVVEAIQSDNDTGNEEDWVSRPPIVTVMGHVDHGKTSLLDNIRNTNVIAGEAGGITQHIGAYNVKLSSGRRITFLDTPGHEAFTAMRARGAKVTDIAIIIVAADDDVMPQTVEAINHASVANVPIVFAVNKIDKPGANPDKIKEALGSMNYLVEEWGGKYQSHDISAKKGIGVEELLEKVLLEADLLNLKANPKRRAVGSIIESALDKGRGYIATVLVENGTLKAGDVILAGTHFGRVKAMFNERNQRVEQAGPSEPVLILGLNGAPQAGDTFNVLETDQEAREIATRREQLQRELGLRTQKMLTLDDIGRRIAVGNFQELNVIVKGDVDGSVEALSDSLIRLSTEEIQVNVIHKAVGQISESDVSLAATSEAIIIGFQVRPSQAARRNAEKEGVEIRLYSVIYDAIEEVRSAMEGMLSPEIKEEITANVEVQQVFKITKVGTIAGCMVKEGKIKRSNKIRLIRDGIVVYSGELDSLKRFKDDVKEVNTGQDCGLNIKNFNDIQAGDIIEAYEETEIRKTL